MFDSVVDHAVRHGWRTIFTKSATSGVQFHKDHAMGTYRHSFIVNADSLRFYLRPPALKIDPTATGWAEANFDDVKSNANQRQETTIALRTVDEAQRAAAKFLS
jgi:hypothetical protein